MTENKIHVLFVCLGNICRSPLAEAVFRNKIKKARLGAKITCFSAGTARWHIGENADHRTIETAAAHNIPMAHKVSQINAGDIDRFEYVLAMDEDNLSEILSILRGRKNGPKIFMMRDFDASRSGEAVPDPYYGEKEDFEAVYDLLDESCGNFLDFIIREHNLS